AYCQGKMTATNYGRDHHPRCFSIWMAGGGTKPGITWGKTDDYGYNIVEGGVHVHDLHATMLRLVGVDHERLTYRFQGRDFRRAGICPRSPASTSRPFVMSIRRIWSRRVRSSRMRSDSRTSARC